MALRRLDWRGFPVVIENEPGSIREWKDAAGNKGQTVIRLPYGCFADQGGRDGDELDVYVGSDPAAEFVYVVHQLNPDGTPDEDKVFVNEPSEAQAKADFLAHRSDGDRAYGGMSAIPVADFIAKLKRRTGGGKIRHSIMSVFSPMRDADGKVKTGVWDYVCVEGRDLKDGTPTRFEPDTLAQMIANFADRGDMVMYDYNHQGLMAQVNGQPAPALAWCGGMAAVWDGRVVAEGYARGVTPMPLDPAGRENGLYSLRSEVTELGDKLLPNFKYLSPGFTSAGQNRHGKNIGYQMLAIACENVPWQAGTELATMTAQMMAALARMGTAPVMMRIEHRNSRYYVVSEEGKPLGDYATEGEAKERLRQVEEHKHAATQTMAVGDDSTEALAVRLKRILDGGGSVSDFEAATIIAELKRRGIRTFPALNAAVGKQIFAHGAARAFDQGVSMDPSLMKKMGFAEGAQPSVEEKMAAYARHSMSGEAEPEHMKAMAADLEQHADHEGAQKMASHMKAMAAKMDAADGDPLPHKEPDGDEAKAMAAEVEEARKEMSLPATMSAVDVLRARRAGSVTMSAVTGMVSDAVTKALAKRDADAEEAKRNADAEALGAEYKKFGASDSQVAAIVTMARVPGNYAAARTIVDSHPGKVALSRLPVSGNGGIGAASSNVRTFSMGGQRVEITDAGTEFAAKTDEILAKSKTDTVLMSRIAKYAGKGANAGMLYGAAQRVAAEDHPDLYAAYQNGAA